MFNGLDGRNAFACALGAAADALPPTSLLQLHDLPDQEIVGQNKKSPVKDGAL
jgi:hypothetical protein